MFPLAGEAALTPGLYTGDGWTEDQFKIYYNGEDRVPDIIDKIKNLYGTGKDLTQKHQISRLHCLYQGDLVNIE